MGCMSSKISLKSRMSGRCAPPIRTATTSLVLTGHARHRLTPDGPKELDAKTTERRTRISDLASVRDIAARTSESFSGEASSNSKWLEGPSNSFNSENSANPEVLNQNRENALPSDSPLAVETQIPSARNARINHSAGNNWKPVQTHHNSSSHSRPPRSIPSAPLPAEPTHKSMQFHRPLALDLTKEPGPQQTFTDTTDRHPVDSFSASQATSPTILDPCPTASTTQYYTPQSTPSSSDASWCPVRSIPARSRLGSFSSESSVSSMDSAFYAPSAQPISPASARPNSNAGHLPIATFDKARFRSNDVATMHTSPYGKIYCGRHNCDNTPYENQSHVVNNVFHMASGSAFNGAINGTSQTLHLAQYSGSYGMVSKVPSDKLGQGTKSKRDGKGYKGKYVPADQNDKCYSVRSRGPVSSTRKRYYGR